VKLEDIRIEKLLRPLYLIGLNNKPSEGAQQPWHYYSNRSVSTGHLSTKRQEVCYGVGTTRQDDPNSRLSKREGSDYGMNNSAKNCGKQENNSIKPNDYYVNNGRKTKRFEGSRLGCQAISRCRITATDPR